MSLSAIESKPLVLLVEDDMQLREFLAHTFSDEFEMQQAGSGEEALAFILRRRPELIVTDIVLPGIDGIELVRILRDRPGTASIPILMTSGRGADELRNGFELGADAYLGKPYTEAELRVRIRGMLKNAQLRADTVRHQVRLEAEQRALEERAALLESITDAFYALDGDWRVTYVNQRALDYFGLQRDAMLGKVFWEVFPQLRNTLGQLESERAVRDKVSVSMEFQSPVSGRWLEVHAYPHGQGLAVNFKDVSARKLADMLLRESEQRLRLMSDALPALVSFIDMDYRYRFCNRRYEEWFGVSREEVVGRTMQELLGEDAFAIVKPSVDRALSGESVSFEAHVDYRIVGPRHVHIDYLPERGEAGDVRGCYALVQDITERKGAELRLRESEEKLRMLNDQLEQRVADVAAERQWFADLVEGTDAFVQVADLDYRWLAINRASAEEFARLFGIHPKVGDNMLELLQDQPDQQAEVRAVWARALAGEEFSVVHESGDRSRRRRFYEMKFNTLRDRSGRLVGAYQFSYDVTQRIEDQARLTAAQDALRQSQKMETLGQLTGGVAHDFNNLLTPIVGALDIVSRKYASDPRAHRMTTSALQAADRAKTLIQRLLAFARRQHLEARAVDVHQLLTGLRELLSRTLGPRVELSIDVSPDCPPALVDPNQLELALLNLAVNARDAMPEGGKLLVRAAAAADGKRLHAGRYVRIVVEDNGLGMDTHTLSRAIEPFFTTKGLGQGTGLGLSMVHGLAAQSGGDFSLDSVPGRGTTALLWLPVADRAPAEIAIESGSSARLQVTRCTVLLVEDEPLVRLATAEMLVDGGYNVVEGASAEEALQLIRGGLRIDALVTDFAMPGCTGVQLARELRTQFPGLPILLITGFATLSEADAEGIPRLDKPFRQTDLLASLAEVIESAAASS